MLQILTEQGYSFTTTVDMFSSCLGGDFTYKNLDSTSCPQVNLDGVKVNGATLGITPRLLWTSSFLAGPNTDVKSFATSLIQSATPSRRAKCTLAIAVPRAGSGAWSASRQQNALRSCTALAPLGEHVAVSHASCAVLRWVRPLSCPAKSAASSAVPATNIIQWCYGTNVVSPAGATLTPARTSEHTRTRAFQVSDLSPFDGRLFIGLATTVAGPRESGLDSGCTAGEQIARS